MAKQESEYIVRDLLFDALFEHLGQPGSREGKRQSARFKLQGDFGEGNCQTEGSLEYALPSGEELSHKNDILVSLSNGRYVAIEVKFLSAVTDQFKARSYDMLYLSVIRHALFKGNLGRPYLWHYGLCSCHFDGNQSQTS